MIAGRTPAPRDRIGSGRIDTDGEFATSCGRLDNRATANATEQFIERAQAVGRTVQRVRCGDGEAVESSQSFGKAGSRLRRANRHIERARLRASQATAIVQMNQPQRFTRSINDRVLAGIVGGIARRYGWNSTMLRVVFVVVSVASAAFPGILVYLILWLLMPEGSD